MLEAGKREGLSEERGHRRTSWAASAVTRTDDGG